MNDVVDDQIDNVKVLYRHIDEKDFINSADVIRDTKNMLKELLQFLFDIQDMKIENRNESYMKLLDFLNDI